MKKEDLTPRNNKGQKHGYCEFYYSNGDIGYKGNYINDNAHGYWEAYHRNGNIRYKGKFIKNEQYGYWEFYYNNGGELNRKEYIIL